MPRLYSMFYLLLFMTNFGGLVCLYMMFKRHWGKQHDHYLDYNQDAMTMKMLIHHNHLLTKENSKLKAKLHLKSTSCYFWGIIEWSMLCIWYFSWIHIINGVYRKHCSLQVIHSFISKFCKSGSQDLLFLISYPSMPWVLFLNYSSLAAASAAPFAFCLNHSKPFLHHTWTFPPTICLPIAT